MASQSRWLRAQRYERSYWQRAADIITADPGRQFTWYEWKAGEMERRLSRFTSHIERTSASVLEIGCGPVGIISRVPWGSRHAIDPLNDFYVSNPVLCKLRDPEVKYQTGTGEKLPYPDGQFSLVILDNMLDHVHNPGVVLDEVKRVLKKDGIIYLAMNVHTTWGAFLHTIMSKLSIDPGHPYTFTADSLREFLKKNRLTLHGDETADYYQARKVDRESDSLKDKIKGYAGLSEFVYYAVASPVR